MIDEDRERLRAKRREWHNIHRESEKARKRESYIKNKERAKRANDKWRKDHPVKFREYRDRWLAKHPGYVSPGRKANPEKVRAYSTLYSAIKAGKVTRPDTCPCGNPNPQGHHSDYSKPLMVMWLCHKCHRKIHGQEGKNEKN